MYVHRVCTMPTKTEEVIRSPRTEAIDFCEQPMGAVDSTCILCKNKKCS